jgi:hypothetical protein
LVDSLQYNILEIANSPVSLEKLNNILIKKYKHIFQQQEIIEVLDDFFFKGIDLS